MRGLVDRIAAELRDSPAAPACVLALAVVLVWSQKDGGFDPIYWAPGTLVLVLLLVVVLANARGSIPGGTPALVALGAFGGFVVWCYLSMLWADVPADAWSGANKTLGYFAIYALFATRPWSARLGYVYLGAYSAGIAVVGAWAIATAARSDDPSASFIEGRLAEPISYPNANCALFLAATLPAILLAARRDVPVVLRGVFLAVAGVLAQLAILCESRMSLAAVPLVLIGFVAIVPDRLRILLALGATAVVGLLTTPALLDVYTAVTESTDVGSAVATARNQIAFSALALFAIGVAWALLDRFVTVGERLHRQISIGLACAGAVLVLVGAGAFLDRYGSPTERVGDWWAEFKAPTDGLSEESHFAIGFAGNGRYEIWKVALEVFADHPLLGVGVDNFAVDWYRRRESIKAPLYPHSVELRTLQQTGLVGTGLLLAFLVGAVVAIARGMRLNDAAARGVAATGLASFAYWFVHGSIDWLWEIPALSVAAFALLGMAVALSPVRPAKSHERHAWARPLTLVGAALVVAVSIVTLVPAWLAEKEVNAALDVWEQTPRLALDHLDRARRLNPLSDEPDVLKAVIAAQVGARSLQREYLLDAIERNEHNWYPMLELGLLESRAGRQRTALQWLERATALNPRDPIIGYVRERVIQRNPPSQSEVDDLFLRSAETLTGVRQD